MLRHVECSRCHAPNLDTEIVCFACGHSLRPLPRWRRAVSAPAPWVLWAGLLVLLAAAGVVGWHLARWLAAYRLRAALPGWHLPAAGGALLAAGQVVCYQARRIDRRWWRMKRAPTLPLSQIHPGDAVWVTGKLRCDSPVVAPFTTQECAYYHYRLEEREEGQAGWRTRERESKTMDFDVTHEGDSLHVPSGGLLVDAPLYLESFVDPSGTVRVHVWALAVDLPISVCGQIAGEADRPRLDALGEDLPAVATWRSPSDYVALAARRARRLQLAGWALTILGALVLVSIVARA